MTEPNGEFKGRTEVHLDFIDQQIGELRDDVKELLKFKNQAVALIAVITTSLNLLFLILKLVIK